MTDAGAEPLHETARPSPVKVRYKIERLDGPTLIGWAYNPATPGQERIEVRLGLTSLPIHVRRFERADVQLALGIEPLACAFAAELPASIWQRLAKSPKDKLQVVIDHQPVKHAVLHPDAASLRRWLLKAKLQSDPAWRASWVELGLAHQAAAAIWAPKALSRTGTASEPPALLHASVEGLSGLLIKGWAWSDPTGSESIGLTLMGQRLPCPVMRVSRQDVAQALGLDDQNFGFEIELPGALWAQVPADSPAELQVLINGAPCGPVMQLARVQLPSMLDTAWSLANPIQRQMRSLLVLEHVWHADAWALLNASQQSRLQRVARAAKLQGLLSGPRGESSAPSMTATAHGIRPSGLWGYCLQWRAPALLALGSLLLLKHLQSRRPAWAAKAVELEVALTRSTGLFDDDGYESQVRADERQGWTALRHYVQQGDARALVPMRLFDPVHYTGQLPGRQPPAINRVLHFALVGRFAGLDPCAWFDTRHYRKTNRGFIRSAQALTHFLNRGWREGRAPVPGFDPTQATARGLNQRLAQLGSGLAQDPMLNYMLSGMPTGRPLPVQDRLPWMPVTSIDGRDYLDEAAWQDLSPRTGPAAVDVIIPVYAGAQETLCCMWSVLTSTSSTPTELVVIDDCSPEPALSAMLRWLATRGVLTLLVNPENLGFVQTVNRGLALHTGRDVVILNSDTEVFGDWLDRLRRTAAAQPRAGSLTPLSNNATLCSYPQTFYDNGNALEMPPSVLDALAAQTNPGVCIAAPTGMGFCMYMRRACLNEVGLLDAYRFGRGYGEENDWCQRATRQGGWRHLICADVFVLHRGSVSFKGEVNERVQAALRLLQETYPDYTRRIDSLIAADPLQPARARLDAARLRTASGRPFALLVSHARGGGTERHEAEQATLLRARGLEVAYLRPSARDGCVALLAPHLLEAVNLAALTLRADDLLLEVLQILPVQEVHLHHLADFPDGVREVLPALCAALMAPLSVTLHDYHFICPRINLVGPTRRYCAEPDAAGCADCLAHPEVVELVGGIEHWRVRHARLLAHARQVRAPDSDVAQRIRRYFPRAAVVVVPHEPSVVPALRLAAEPKTATSVPRNGVSNEPAAPSALSAPAGPVHVLAIGALSLIKGFEVLRQLAYTPQHQALGMRLTLLGQSMDDAALSQAGVRVLGRYDDETLNERVAALAPDLIFIPSVWPETYCYVLTAALRAGCPVAVFDLGAQARRWRESGAPGVALPLALALEPDLLAGALVDVVARARALSAYS
jgi:GT2 family glycosyltransferase